jgi:hypothetical protein
VGMQWKSLKVLGPGLPVMVLSQDVSLIAPEGSSKDYIWIYMILYGFIWYKMIYNGFIWYKMIYNGFIWYKMIYNGFIWYKMIYN